MTTTLDKLMMISRIVLSGGPNSPNERSVLVQFITHLKEELQEIEKVQARAEILEELESRMLHSEARTTELEELLALSTERKKTLEKELKAAKRRITTMRNKIAKLEAKLEEA